MKLLLDENLSHRLRPLLAGHEVFTVAFMRWRGLSNGALLAKAAEAGFDALITMDAGIQYEQNLSALPCSVVILEAESNALEHLKPLVPQLLQTLGSLKPQSCARVR
jgi:predicted nuclease of predicted toxin-antitoxin system